MSFIYEDITMQSKDHINAFQTFTEQLAASPIHVEHSGVNGVNITVNNPADYLEADEISAENDFQNFLSAEGLESMTLEDALNGNFPNASVEMNVELSVNTESKAVQDGKAIPVLKELLQQAISRLDELEGDEDNSYFTYETITLKRPGTDEVLGEFSIDISNDSD